MIWLWLRKTETPKPNIRYGGNREREDSLVLIFYTKSIIFYYGENKIYQDDWMDTKVWREHTSYYRTHNNTIFSLLGIGDKTSKKSSSLLQGTIISSNCSNHSLSTNLYITLCSYLLEGFTLIPAFIVFR